MQCGVDCLGLSSMSFRFLVLVCFLTYDGSTWLNFLTTYVRPFIRLAARRALIPLSQVIHTQLLTFHKAFQQAKSLDDMILLHED